MSAHTEPLTIDGVADVLVEAILPFYKGFPHDATNAPRFRKTLTGEESTNLLTTIHHVVAAIRIQKKEMNGDG